MKSATRIALAAALSITSITLAHASRADDEHRQVVALADVGAVRGPAVDVPLESYAGRYVAEDGRVFQITVGDEAVTLETTESSGLMLLTLRAVDSATFESADGAVRVTFSLAADGDVSGASITGAGTREAVATTREPLRGVVTILDSVDEAAAAGVLRRGVVTIYDVTDFATGGVAAN